MPYFINIRIRETLLREGREAIGDLYEACGRAALLASDLESHSNKSASGLLVVEVVDSDGAAVFRIPVGPQQRDLEAGNDQPRIDLC